MMGDDLRFCHRAILMLFSKALLSGVWAGLTFFYIQLWRFNMKAAEKIIKMGLMVAKEPSRSRCNHTRYACSDEVI